MKQFKSTFAVGDSAIHGKGCFTTIDLCPGMFFPVPYHFIEEYEADEYAVWFEDMDPLHPLGPFKFLNHKNKPKAALVWCEDYGLMLEILRHVKAGREVTIHYGEDW